MFFFNFSLTDLISSSNPCFSEKSIQSERREKDETFKQKNSPLPDDLKAKFKGLKYYSPDSKYAVKATFTKNKKKVKVKIQASKKNDIRNMYIVGVLSFSISGVKLKLNAYSSGKNPSEPLFIPFTDKTSSNETYDAGRYLDINIKDSEISVCLDFNLCYNPYCAYNKKYSCPLVPKENNLNIEIKAGEKKYH